MIIFQWTDTLLGSEMIAFDFYNQSKQNNTV